MLMMIQLIGFFTTAASFVILEIVPPYSNHPLKSRIARMIFGYVIII